MKSNPKITFWINNIKPDTTEIFKIFMRLIFITKLRSTEYFIFLYIFFLPTFLERLFWD